MAFENNKFSMNRQAISNRFLCFSSEIVQFVVAEFTKMLKTLIFTQNSNKSDLRRKPWFFYVCMMFVMRKTHINLN